MFEEPLQTTGGGSVIRAMPSEVLARRAQPSIFGDADPLLLEPEQAPSGPHALNLRWLIGTVLAGVGGVALLAAALLVALDGRANFATLAKLTIVDSQSQVDGDDSSPDKDKGDKIVQSVDEGGARLTATFPDTITLGNREVIKTRVFTRVTTPLALTMVNAADQIPAYDPLKIVASASEAAVAPEYNLEDADVAMVKSQLSNDDVLVFAKAALSDDDAMAQVASSVGAQPALPLAGGPLWNEKVASQGLAGALPTVDPAELPPFSSIDVKVVPENVTVVAKDQGKAAGTSERIVIAKRGDTFDELLSANGASKDALAEIKTVLAAQHHDTTISPGQKLRLLVARQGADGGRSALLRVATYADNEVSAIVAADDDGAFHAVTPAAPASSKNASAHNDDQDSDEGPSLYESVYETALHNQIPRPVIDALIRIFAYDVDFQARARPDDSFDILYARDDNGTHPDQQDILYAKLTTGNEVRAFYRYQARDGAQVEYFDQNGKSANKFLLRKPIEGGKVTSPFGMRFHPILGVARMHTGVDWGAPAGTPVFAAGNGTVIRASYDAGNGNRIEIQHTNGYVTGYDHLSAYVKGIAPGVKVHQGQVIGFIGSTGLATGPHLHYEVIVNGQFYDPLRIKLPHGHELDGSALAEFQGERRHVDDILSRFDDPVRLTQSSTN